MKAKRTQTQIYLFSISFVLLISLSTNSCKNQSENKSNKNLKIAEYYFEQMELSIPNEEYTFYILPSISCIGCRYTIVNYIPDSKNSVLIIANNIIKQEPKFIGVENTIIDSLNLADKLNWRLGNLIEIKTDNKGIISIRDYTADEIYNTFTKYVVEEEHQ